MSNNHARRLKKEAHIKKEGLKISNPTFYFLNNERIIYTVYSRVKPLFLKFSQHLQASRPVAVNGVISPTNQLVNTFFLIFKLFLEPLKNLYKTIPLIVI